MYFHLGDGDMSQKCPFAGYLCNGYASSLVHQVDKKPIIDVLCISSGSVKCKGRKQWTVVILHTATKGVTCSYNRHAVKYLGLCEYCSCLRDSFTEMFYEILFAFCLNCKAEKSAFYFIEFNAVWAVRVLL